MVQLLSLSTSDSADRLSKTKLTFLLMQCENGAIVCLPHTQLILKTC